MASARISYRLCFPSFAVVGAILALALAAMPFVSTPTIYTSLATAGFVLVLPWMALLWSNSRKKSGEATLQEDVRRMCATDLHQLSVDGPAIWQGQLDESHPVAIEVRNALVNHARQFDELQQARQGADIRVRRVTTERDQLVQVFRGLAEPIVAVDAYGEIVLTNDSFLELFGLKRDQTEQKPADKIIPCPPLLEALEALRRRRSSAARTTEACSPSADGRSRWFRVTCRPITAIGGAAEESQSGTVAVLADITSQKLVQQRNAEFVAAVSHEMKTPLSSIKASVELLADGEAEDEATREEFLGVINGQTDRLKRLIDNLLNLARIEAGVVAVNKESQSLNQILQESIEVLRPAAEQRKITLVSELSPLYLGVLADRDTLLQAVINLLSNAVKYTREGGTVTVRSRASEASVEFEVQDTGVGLSEEDTHKVFEKFYRVKKDKDMAAGTGLGLPLVKHIVEDIHRGQIAVRSTLGEGSTFSVVLPQVRSASH